MIGMEIGEVEAYVRRLSRSTAQPLDDGTTARLRVLFDVNGRRLQADPPDER